MIVERQIVFRSELNAILRHTLEDNELLFKTLINLEFKTHHS